MSSYFVYPVQEGSGVFRGSTPVWEHSVIQIANNGTYYLRSGNFVGDGYFGAVGYTANVCVVVSDDAPEDFIPPSLTGTTDADPPSSGKPWGPVAPVETPDGATTVFTMPAGYTWSEGSLKVFVDDLDQTAAVTSEDGTAAPATFTLSFSPWGTDTITVFGIQL